MRKLARLVLGCAVAGCLACATATRETVSSGGAPAAPGSGALARIYYWRARPGKLDEYGRYIRDVAEPIDREAQRAGAFMSVTTYVSRDSASTWTHMRVFILRDSTQLAGLSGALDAAGKRVEPDSARRRVRGEYSATLRDRAGDATVEVLR
ncbi:MAG TPA: hypothetical protein VHE78_19925 [Gemmatimonadaceae bacterium]|nr:hypothetical protein [Gemmatimonadaceae bacterium]